MKKKISAALFNRVSELTLELYSINIQYPPFSFCSHYTLSAYNVNASFIYTKACPRQAS